MRNKDNAYHIKRKPDFKIRPKTALKVVTVSGAITVSALLSAVALDNLLVDHLHTKCPFNWLFGVDHQVQHIEEMGYTAYHRVYQEQVVKAKGNVVEVWDGVRHERDELAPEGYEKLDQTGKAFDYSKTEILPEAIVVLDKDKRLVLELLL